MRDSNDLRSLAVDIIVDVVADIDKSQVWESAQSFGENITSEEQQALVDLIRKSHLTVEFEGDD